MKSIKKALPQHTSESLSIRAARAGDPENVFGRADLAPLLTQVGTHNDIAPLHSLVYHNNCDALEHALPHLTSSTALHVQVRPS